jgi:hypothetical protein
MNYHRQLPAVHWYRGGAGKKNCLVIVAPLLILIEESPSSQAALGATILRAPCSFLYITIPAAAPGGWIAPDLDCGSYVRMTPLGSAASAGRRFTAIGLLPFGFVACNPTPGIILERDSSNGGRQLVPQLEFHPSVRWSGRTVLALGVASCWSSFVSRGRGSVRNTNERRS